MMPKSPETENCTLGLISDTHGRLPTQINNIFEHVDGILHAGDIGSGTILEALELIAPVVAVKGNMDWGSWTSQLREIAIFSICNIRIGLVHDRYQLPTNRQIARCRVIVSGHTHRALIEERNGVLLINPGSAGQPRANRPASVALLHISDQQVSARIIQLEDTQR